MNSLPTSISTQGRRRVAATTNFHEGRGGRAPAGSHDSSRWSRKYFGGGDGPTPHAAIWSGSDPYWVIVCLAAHSPTPVIRPEWVKRGTHVSSVGYYPPDGELPKDVAREHRLSVAGKGFSLAMPAWRPSVTRDPISDIVWPIHSFRKSELCQRLVGRKFMSNRVAHP